MLTVSEASWKSKQRNFYCVLEVCVAVSYSIAYKNILVFRMLCFPSSHCR